MNDVYIIFEQQQYKFKQKFSSDDTYCPKMLKDKIIFDYNKVCACLFIDLLMGRRYKFYLL